MQSVDYSFIVTSKMLNLETKLLLIDENTVQQSLRYKIPWIQVLLFILWLTKTGLYLWILLVSKENFTKIVIS